MSPRTVFLSRLLGLYYVLAALSMFLHKQAFVGTVTALLRDSPVMFIVSIVTLFAGLAMILGHNIWSSGAAAVVSTIGWITLIKGLLFLFLPPEMQSGFFLTQLHYEQYFYAYASLSLVLGIYLTYAGFKPSLRA